MYRASSAWNLRFFFTLDVVVTLYDNDVEMIHPSNCIHFNYVISFQVKDIVLQKLIYEYEDDLLLSSGHTAFFSRRGEEDGIDHGCMLLSCVVSHLDNQVQCMYNVPKHIQYKLDGIGERTTSLVMQQSRALRYTEMWHLVYVHMLLL